MLLFLLVFLPLFLGMAQADEYDDLQRQKDQTLEEINRKKSAERLELSKYCRYCKKHTGHKETK